MACLAIVQQEQGHVPRCEDAIAAYLGMPADCGSRGHDLLQHVQPAARGQVQMNVCTNLPCQLRDGQKALDHLCSKLGIEQGGTTADGLFTVQPSECLGACADSPVMLVNDRQMCSFMSRTLDAARHLAPTRRRQKA